MTMEDELRDLRKSLQTVTLKHDRIQAELDAYREAMRIAMGSANKEAVAIVDRIAAGLLGRGGF